MAKMIFELSDKLDKEFRETVMEVRGLHKGVIKQSLEEAIEEWIALQKKRKKGSNQRAEG